MKSTDEQIIAIAQDERLGGYTPQDRLLAFARRMIELGAARENEECARLCDGPNYENSDAIRARRKA